MKPLYVAIKKDNKIAVAVNSQDIKVVHIREPKDGRFNATITLSGDEVSAPLTQHAVDKMRAELRDRYNVVHIDTFGVKRPHTDHKNDLLEIKVHGQGTFLVFPKALRSVQACGQLLIDAFGKSIRVNMTNRPETDRLQLMSCNAEEV
jgi:hypothetical protein